MVRVEGAREYIYPVVEAVGMWESRRDFQRVWEGWKAGFMAFHAFHTLSFPWPAFAWQTPNQLTSGHLAHCACTGQKLIALRNSIHEMCGKFPLMVAQEDRICARDR